MRIYINNETEYELLNYYQVTERAIKETLSADGADGDSETVSVTFVSGDEIRLLNRSYRGIDSITDVLSFPAGIYADGNHVLGDIIICFDRACAQAREYGNTVKGEVAFLAVHGALHLLGYDHIDDEEEALMRCKQRLVMGNIKDALI